MSDAATTLRDASLRTRFGVLTRDDTGFMVLRNDVTEYTDIEVMLLPPKQTKPERAYRPLLPRSEVNLSGPYDPV